MSLPRRFAKLLDNPLPARSAHRPHLSEPPFLKQRFVRTAAFDCASQSLQDIASHGYFGECRRLAFSLDDDRTRIRECSNYRSHTLMRLSWQKGAPVAASRNNRNAKSPSLSRSMASLTDLSDLFVVEDLVVACAALATFPVIFFRLEPDLLPSSASRWKNPPMLDVAMVERSLEVAGEALPGCKLHMLLPPSHAFRWASVKSRTRMQHDSSSTNT